MRYPSVAELLELSQEDRLQLLEDVWETLRSDPARLPITDEHRRELQRRLEAWERQPEAGVAWNELRDRLRGS